MAVGQRGPTVRRPGPYLAAAIGAALGRQFWLRDWGQALLVREAGRMPALERIAAQSAWNFLDNGVEGQIVAGLGGAIESGRWDAAYGGLRTQAFYDGGYRLVVSARVERSRPFMRRGRR